MEPRDALFAALAPEIYDVRTTAPGPAGALPLTEAMLLERPSGDLFGLTQNAGMAARRPAGAGRPGYVDGLGDGRAVSRGARNDGNRADFRWS